MPFQSSSFRGFGRAAHACQTNAARRTQAARRGHPAAAAQRDSAAIAISWLRRVVGSRTQPRRHEVTEKNGFLRALFSWLHFVWSHTTFRAELALRQAQGKRLAVSLPNRGLCGFWGSCWRVPRYISVHLSRTALHV